MPAAAAGAGPAGRRAGLVAIAALAVAAIATAAALWGWLRPRPAPAVQRYSVLLRPNEGLRPSGIAGNLAISPDGNRIAYIGVADGGTRLWLREHDKLRPLPIAGTENGLSPFFSPDGNQVAFTIDGRSLRVAPLNGGPPVTLTDSINSAGGDWGQDGYIYIELDDGLGRIKATGGPIERLFTMSDAKHEIGAEYPNVMPDGKGIVFRRRLAGQAPNDFEIMEMAVPQGTPRVITRGVYARYATSGHLLVVTGDGKLLAMPFNPKKREVTGPERGRDGRPAPLGAVRGELRGERQRNAGLLVGRQRGRDDRLVGGPRRRRGAGGHDLEARGEHQHGGALAGRPVARGHAGTGRGGGHLGQAAPDGAVLAGHLRRYGPHAGGVDRRRAVAGVHQRPRLGRRPADDDPGRRYGRAAGHAPVEVPVRAGGADGRRQMAGAPPLVRRGRGAATSTP